jgi:hypothetical protein
MNHELWQRLDSAIDEYTAADTAHREALNTLVERAKVSGFVLAAFDAADRVAHAARSDREVAAAILVRVAREVLEAHDNEVLAESHAHGHAFRDEVERVAAEAMVCGLTADQLGVLYRAAQEREARR